MSIEAEVTPDIWGRHLRQTSKADKTFEADICADIQGSTTVHLAAPVREIKQKILLIKENVLRVEIFGKKKT